MNLLFIADPLASFKTYKDTTYAMMREAAARGHTLFHTLAAQLSVQNGSVVAQASQIQFLGAKDDHDHAMVSGCPRPKHGFNRVQRHHHAHRPAV